MRNAVLKNDKIDGLLGDRAKWRAFLTGLRCEIPTHLSCFNISYTWKGTHRQPRKPKDIAIEKLYRTHWSHEERPLRVFSINVEAINTAQGYDAVERFIKSCRVMATVDESTRIKNPDAKRSKKVVELGRLAEARRILFRNTHH